MAAPAPDPAMERADKAALWLAGAFTLATGALTALGVASGALEQLFLNRTPWALAAFGLIALAVAMAVIAYVGQWPPALEGRLLLVGGVAFAVGLILAVSFAILNPTSKQEPALTASFVQQDGTVLHASVKAEHVKSHTQARLLVDGLVDNGGKFQFVANLYQSLLGPDSSGVIDRSVDVPIPPGRFTHVAVSLDIGDELTEDHCKPGGDLFEGCAILAVPRGPIRPELSATLAGKAGSRQIGLKVDAIDVAMADAAVVRVTETGGGRRRVLYSATLEPDTLGGLDAPLTVNVDAFAKRVCAAAKLLGPDALLGQIASRVPGCPPHADADTAWTRVRIPR